MGYPLYHATIDDGVVSEPAQLLPDGGSPMLSPIWSDDEQWLAFGVSGGDAGGIYVFSVATENVSRVTPEGAGYNPLYAFAPGQNLLAIYTVTTEPELGVVALDDVAVDGAISAMRWQTVMTGGATTPSEWSFDGSFLFHGSTGSAEFVPVSADGRVGTPIAFPEGSYGCPLHWITPTAFYFRACSGTSLELASVTADGIATETVAGDVPSLFTRGHSGGCFVNYSPDELRFGAFTPAYFEAGTRRSVNPTAFAFAPDDSGVAWYEGTSVMWQEWDSACVPQGDAEPHDRVEGVSILAFLPN
jgi:hypothetical protein